MAIVYTCDRSRKRTPADEVVKLRVLRSPGSAEIRARYGYELHLSADEGVQFLAWLARRDHATPEHPALERAHGNGRAAHKR